MIERSIVIPQKPSNVETRVSGDRKCGLCSCLDVANCKRVPRPTPRESRIWEEFCAQDDRNCSRLFVRQGIRRLWFLPHAADRSAVGEEHSPAGNICSRWNPSDVDLALSKS